MLLEKMGGGDVPRVVVRVSSEEVEKREDSNSNPPVMGDGCVSGGFLDRKGAGMRAEGGGGLNSFTSFGGNLYSTPLVPGKPHRLLWGGFGFKS